MRTLSAIAPAVGLLFLAVAAHAQGGVAAQPGHAASVAATTAAQSPGDGALSPSAEAFLKRVAQGSDYELAIAKLAEQKASRQDIKRYAQAVVSDHDQLNGSLRELARKHGVQLPKGMTEQQRDKLSHMRGLSGTAFDQAYVVETRRINQEDKTELQKEVNSAQNPDVKVFAQQMQAADAKHDQMAQAMQAKG